MKPGHLALFVMCAVLASCPQTWANGVQFLLNRAHNRGHDQLLCSLATNQEDQRIFSIIEIAIIDFTNSVNKLKLASASALASDLYVQNDRNIDIKVTGTVSRYHAELDIRFGQRRRCELGNYLCELTFVNLAGHVDKIHAAVKAKLTEDIRSNLTDDSELMVVDQLNELRNHFDDTVNLLANRTEKLEERLVQLTGRLTNSELATADMTSLIDNTQQEKQDNPPTSPDRANANGSYPGNSEESAKGSQVNFVSTPDTITLGLTRNLTLRCSLSDSTDQSNGSVPIRGRPRREVKVQDVSSNHIISAIISKIGEKNEAVASVALGSSPAGFVDTGNLKVQGHVLSQPEEQAYLKVTWPRPGPDLGGTYECKINAVDAIGFPISYVQDLQVDITEPSLTQLVQRLWEIEENSVKDVQDIQSDLTVTKSELTTTKSDLNTTKQQFASIMSKVNNLSPAHAEQGMVYCCFRACDVRATGHVTDVYLKYSETDSRHFQNGKQISQHVAFKRPYMSPPVVLLSANAVWTATEVRTSGSTGWSNSFYEVSAHNVTTDGFDITCSDPARSNEYVYYINVYWMSTVSG